MRTAEEVNSLYFAFLDNLASIGKEACNDRDFLYVENNKGRLNIASHILFTFEDCWNYLDLDTQNKTCDLAATFLFEKQWAS